MGLGKWFFILASANLAAGSAQAQPPAHKEEVVSGVQVGIGRCAFAAPRSGEDRERILSVIAGAAISKGVNLLTSAITSAAAAKTWTASGSRNFETTSDDFPQCVQIARGKFYANRAELGGWATRWHETNRTALLANGLFLAETPEFFFEGEFSASEDNSALSIRPVYSAYNGPIGKRFLRPGSNRSIAVFLAITAPGTKPSLETAPAATIILGEQTPPTYKSYPPAGKTYRSPVESTWFTLAKADTRKPFTLHALVTETQGADAFMAFIASVLSEDKVKTAITTQASQILIPSVGAAADATEAAAAAKAANNADQLFAAAMSKLDACRTAAPGALIAAASQAKVALRDYSFADRALAPDARTDLVGDEQINRLRLEKPEMLKQACEATYQEIVASGG